MPTLSRRGRWRGDPVLHGCRRDLGRGWHRRLRHRRHTVVRLPNDGFAGLSFDQSLDHFSILQLGLLGLLFQIEHLADHARERLGRHARHVAERHAFVTALPKERNEIGEKFATAMVS